MFNSINLELGNLESVQIFWYCINKASDYDSVYQGIYSYVTMKTAVYDHCFLLNMMDTELSREDSRHGGWGRLCRVAKEEPEVYPN
ncbi:hypothetical protein P8452_01511 [Trifolium repens]|nr:hypothetical protein P8452_01511 [Trifolium repens]